jgi:hypothetical protein
VAGSLKPVKDKLDRAIRHLKELDGELERYFKTNPAKMVREVKGKPDEFFAKFVLRDFPQIPLIIGDCLQNARSALDYLVWELVLAAKEKPGKNNGFPICKSPEAFNDQLVKQRKLEGVPKDAVTEIQSLQPWVGGPRL